MRDLGTSDFEADSFYFDKSIDLIDARARSGPLFLYVYTVANHFPWDKKLRPELTPDWHDLGNAPDVDEYVRRQGMSAKDYREFLAKTGSEVSSRIPFWSFAMVIISRSLARLSSTVHSRRPNWRSEWKHLILVT